MQGRSQWHRALRDKKGSGHFTKMQEMKTIPDQVRTTEGIFPSFEATCAQLNTEQGSSH